MFKFHCPHCNQRIEADDSDAGQKVDCPACSEAFTVPFPDKAPPTPPPTEILLPKKEPSPPPRPKKDTNRSVSKNAERPATPKQIAYLSYMGVEGAAGLAFKEASAAIEDLYETDIDELYYQRRERQSNWITERFTLYPDLYASEIKDMLNTELPETLHSYVRSQVVGASEKLTKAKIKKVIASLSAESPQWWQSKDMKRLFFDRLSRLYPNCVDGKSPNKSQSSSPSQKDGLKERIRNYQQELSPHGKWSNNIKKPTQAQIKQVVEALDEHELDWEQTHGTEPLVASLISSFPQLAKKAAKRKSDGATESSGCLILITAIALVLYFVGSVVA